MMHTSNDLYKMLTHTMYEVDYMITAQKKQLARYIEDLPYAESYTVYDIVDDKGRPKLSDLMVAKAQLLSAMAQLKASDIKETKGPRR